MYPIGTRRLFLRSRVDEHGVTIWHLHETKSQKGMQSRSQLWITRPRLASAQSLVDLPDSS